MKIRRPQGIFPSLPSGMDRAIKNYFDSFRTKGLLPPELYGPNFDGVQLYQDQTQLNKWRNWRTGLVYQDKETNTSLSGALDELLVKDKTYIPLDYKTKGSPTTEEAAIEYYQTQLDCYAFLLEANGLPTIGHAFLMTYSPKKVHENGTIVFETQIIKVKTDLQRVLKIFRNAVSLLREDMPPANESCEYCAWLTQSSQIKKI